MVIANYNDGIMKPLAENDRNGLEYYSPVNFESIDIHFWYSTTRVPYGWYTMDPYGNMIKL